MGFAIYTRYAIEPTTAPSISYIAHLTGALAGLTIGLLVLKSFEQKLHEQLIWWIALGVYSACTIFAIVYNLLNTITAQKFEENEEVFKKQLFGDFGIWKWKQWSELWMKFELKTPTVKIWREREREKIEAEQKIIGCRWREGESNGVVHVIFMAYSFSSCAWDHWKCAQSLLPIYIYCCCCCWCPWWRRWQ